MVWTCSLIDEPWVVPLLGNVAVTTGTGRGGSSIVARSEKIANAVVGTLARRGGLDIAGSLARLQAKARRRPLLELVERTLDAVAVRAGLSREQLTDRTVYTFGLDQDGVLEKSINGYLVRLHADALKLSFVNPSGKTLRSAPEAIRKDPELADIKSTLKELRLALAGERLRLESALVEERSWSWEEVTEFFLDHPFTGLYARALLWQIPDGPAGLPTRTPDGWTLTDHQGRHIRPEPGSPMRLWHPIRESTEEVAAWRDHLLEQGVRQPYKQAFREIYRLTPAEEVTRTYSNRFAGHVLRYGQVKALLSQRGWDGVDVGFRSHRPGGDPGAAHRRLSGWQARWEILVEGWHPEADCDTRRLGFFDDDGDVPLADVPPLVLSEILRDADLAVGVASIGLGATAPRGHETYWNSHGFGELSETARTRHDALTRLLPRLKIADRAELTDRFLRVRGDLRTYKIHLGSGNILMEPNDAYLCIVPG